VAFRTVEKVQPIAHFFYSNRVLLSVVFQDELLKVQKRALVRNLLSDLYHGLPSIFGSEFCAIGALTVLYQVLNLECLLQDRIR
jgi:hypothetical protein